MSNKNNDIWFDSFRLSLSEKCLFRGSVIISLTGREFDILAALVEHSGAVVQKEELCQCVWPNRDMDASNLTHHVRSLRKKLGERADGLFYIETVAGRGYRFTLTQPLPLSEPRPENCGSDQPNPQDQSESYLREVQADLPFLQSATYSLGPPPGVIPLASLVLLFAVACPYIIQELRSAPVKVAVLTAPDNSIPKLSRLIPTISDPYQALFIPQHDKVYVSEPANNSIVVIQVTNDNVQKRISTGRAPRKMELSADKRTVFVAQSGGAGLGAINTDDDSYSCFAPLPNDIEDLAVAPDGNSIYLSLGFHGVAKIDTHTRIIRVVSKSVYAEGLAITPDGRRLYVSYQSEGPGGRRGHDAIAYFETHNERIEGAITGFANVGSCMTATIDGSEVWESGQDACDSPQYDHVGCPIVPGGLVNVFNARSSTLIRALGIRGERTECTTFSPDGQFAVLGSSDHLMMIRRSDTTITASLSLGSTGNLAFTPDGLKAYAPVDAKPQVAVIQTGALVEALRLTNQLEADHEIQVAILSSPEFDAKSIDPGSLRLGGKAAKRTRSGMIASSIEHVAGSFSHSLVVRFPLDPAEATSRLVIVGYTYSGVPIRAVLDPI